LFAPATAEAQSAVETWIADLPVKPAILAELDYRTYPSAVQGSTGFAVGRFRPGLAFAPAPWFISRATVEFAAPSPVLLDLFAIIHVTPWLHLGAGFMKPPLFATFRFEPDAYLPFPDFSALVTTFRIFRDLGVEMHLNPKEIPLEFIVRLGNGTGSVLANDNALPAGYALLDLVLGRARDPEATHGLRLGASALIESVKARDGIAGRTPLGFVYYKPTPIAGLRLVSEAHAIAYLGPYRMTLEGVLAHEERPDLRAVRSYGLGAEAVWVLRGRPRSTARNPYVAEEDWSGGALEVGMRWDSLWLGRKAPDVTDGGSMTGSASLKWWPTSFLAATLYLFVAHFDQPPPEDPNADVSWGLQLRASLFWGI
jgi:phosphate-selective porin OprO/OprP